ncbi:MAG: fatty acid desaturase [Acidobacteriia bacterium]|nr:fatty acid desaturase [Terriglobia bacterium]
MTTLEAVRELRNEFGRRGWDRKATARIVFELLAHVTIALAGMVIFMLSHNLALEALGLLISAFGCMGVGTNTHTSTHYGTSDKRWLNEALSYFGYPMFVGLSATFWWHKHVVLHHPAPNVVGVDSDADLLPWFAITANEVHASSGFRRFYHRRLQFWLFPLALAVNCISIQMSGWVYLLGMLRHPKRRKSAHWIDAGALVLHYVLWIGVPLLFWPLPAVAAFYGLRAILLGYAMYAVLAPGHFPAEAQRTTDEVRRAADFFEVQTAGTVSFRTGLLGRFLCSGLEYQVEHHLFPNISHVHYPQVSVAVQAFCAEHGLSYRSYTWAEALWKSWQVLRHPQQVLGQAQATVPVPGSSRAA